MVQHVANMFITCWHILMLLGWHYSVKHVCNDWSEASGFTCSKMFNEQRQKQTGNGQQAKTGISEAEQRRKQYQAGVEVTGTGSEFQGRAVRGQTQRWQEE